MRKFTIVLALTIAALSVLMLPGLAGNYASTATSTRYAGASADGERVYTEYVPPHPSTTLVLALPGYRLPSTWVAYVTGLEGFSYADGFILDTLNGLAESWNAGGCCGYAVSHNVDDIGYIDTVIGQSKARHEISKVYLVGFSNGGMMAYRYGCDHAVYGIAVVSGDNMTGCTPASRVALLDIHGLKDGTVPYKGGKTNLATFPPVENGVNSWRQSGAWVKTVRIAKGSHDWSNAYYGVSDAVRQFVDS